MSKAIDGHFYSVLEVLPEGMRRVLIDGTDSISHCAAEHSSHCFEWSHPVGFIEIVSKLKAHSRAIESDEVSLIEENLQHALDHSSRINEVFADVVMDAGCLSKQLIKLGEVLPLVSGKHFLVDNAVLNESLEHGLPLISNSDHI